MRPPAKLITTFKAALVLAALVIFAASCLQQARKSNLTITATNTNLRASERISDTDKTYGAFSHSVPEHNEVNCDSCHQRDSEGTKLAFPGHDSCVTCHMTEFTNTKSGICASCHSDIQAVPATMKQFPTRFVEGFNMKFDHAAHMTGDGRPPDGCASCHLPAGASQSIPSGVTAHSTCYTCHTPESTIGSCNICHTIAPYTRTPATSNVMKAVFHHSDHTPRQGVNCAECHNVRASSIQSRQVSSPSAVEHVLNGKGISCRTCHNDRRAFGDSNFSNCAKCHAGPGFKMLPTHAGRN